MGDTGLARESQTEIRQKALREELHELLDVVGPAQLVDLLLERAYQLHTTDIHLDPQEAGLRVRVRVDGLLHEVLTVPPELAPQMISRVKLMAGMNITEKRLAQDGHISQQFLDQQRDVRVGSGPTTFGERLVLRLMPDSRRFRRLEELGLDADQTEQLRAYLRLPYGMILAAGPVGSGKSTTMYNCLELVNDDVKSLVTIEDPVERRILGVNQIQIDQRIGFGFVEALRGVLRQDPNVVMIGEIRDPETAHIGVRAARTGMLVLSTLHANDAAAAFDVFRDFNVPAMLLAETLQLVLSQRLLRTVCRHCKTDVPADPAAREILGLDRHDATEVRLARGRGCDACFQTGYLGRTGVFELIAVDDDLKHGLYAGLPRGELVKIARAKGMRSLAAAAARKVLDGMTTVEEMTRVLLVDPLSGPSLQKGSSDVASGVH
jgi:type II secretory ATPase GspE/PulE/Tfp pilus assembly ATPase PilB-like protein